MIHILAYGSMMFKNILTVKGFVMKYHAFALFLLLLSYTGCKDEDNPVQSPPSIEERINAAQPITWVSIYSGTSITNQFYKNGGTLTNAYAEKGYFIVITTSTHYYNLSLATEIEIRDHSIYLRY